MAHRGTRLGRRDLALALAIPALLVAVAVLQLVRVHRYDQSSWSGIGFGMFATYESATTRFVRAYVDTPSGRRMVELPPGLDDELRLARVVPTAAKLRPLAEAVLERHRAAGATSARLELWMVDVDQRDEGVEVTPYRHAVAEVR